MSAPDQSTAYGRLWWALWDNYTHAEKRAIADAFAHELAEKIRREARVYGALRSEDMRMRAEGLRMGADLIDPMKEDDRG